MKRVLITGGAGFVGSNLSIKLKKDFNDLEIISFDNLKRSGSELNISRLKQSGVEFVHGDVRNKEDLASLGKFDLLIECSAEPSVLAGYNSSPDYLINTNLIGMLNCLEVARQYKADFIFLSTSRVYPIKTINDLEIIEEETRFSIKDNQSIKGASSNGFSEAFPLEGTRSLYGATKLSGEYFLQEYIEAYNMKGVINRCGVITGPWQMGKVDQGFVVLWVAKHIYNKELKYIGFNGTGKQVRDMLHINDLYRLIKMQVEDIDKFNGKVYNVGGGLKSSVSLLELTDICQTITKNKIKINSEKETRQADIKVYITDNTKIISEIGWKPELEVGDIVEDVYKWIKNNEEKLKPILS
jgi:CDP-paratose 2-epimerase